MQASVARRPASGTVQNSVNKNGVLSNPVNGDQGCSSNDELASARYASWASDVRKFRKLLDRSEDLEHRSDGGVGVVLTNVGFDGVKVFGRR